MSNPSGQDQRSLDSWLSNPSRQSHHRGSDLRRGQGYSNQSQRDSYARRKANLAAVGKETREILPDILPQLPHLQAQKSEVLFLETLPQLQSKDCPKHNPPGKAKIKIVNEDSFNAAIQLASVKTPTSGRVAILNMASHANPGGGWLSGASAQEEALCYRSSLALSLHKRYYPWKQRMGVYTPDVLVIRSDMASGHKLLTPGTKAADLPVFSVLSIAAVRRPETRKERHPPTGPNSTVREVYASAATRDLTKDKMRLCLRMAAHRGHGLLVLGALGCGAFRNPPREVAQCWLEVLREAEFQGGWWEEIWFAVFDRRNEGNFEVFEEVLGGVEV